MLSGAHSAAILSELDRKARWGPYESIPGASPITLARRDRELDAPGGRTWRVVRLPSSELTDDERVEARARVRVRRHADVGSRID